MAVTRRGGRSGRSRFTLLLLVLTSITVITLDFRGSGFIDGLRGGALDVFAPVKDAADSAFDPVADIWNGIFAYDDVAAENQRLRAELEDVASDQARADDAIAELDALMELQGLTFTGDIPTATARVVSGPASNFEHTIELDRGRSAGIAIGMPVVASGGLVGRVERVTDGRTIVRLVTDPTFRVGVRLAESRDVGVARGQGDDRPLLVDTGIDPDTEVADGEAVLTSGLNRSAFPPSVPVGTVTDRNVRSGELEQELEVELGADLASLSFVRVLLWEPIP